jgi:hypothetical protein
MLTCREVPEVLTDPHLSFSQKLQLRFHLFICTRCRALKVQFEVLHRNLQRRVSKYEALDPKLAEKIVFSYLDKKD